MERTFTFPLVLFTILLLSSFSSYGQRRQARLEPGDETNLGYGVTYLSPSAIHLHLDARGISKSAGIGFKLSAALAAEKVLRLADWSLAGDLLIDASQTKWYLAVGWRYAASYLSTWSNTRPVSYFNGPTLGVNLELWRPSWLPNDRMVVGGYWWFSRTTTAWREPPPAPKVVVTLTYFFI